MLSAPSLVTAKHVSLPARASIKAAATGRAQARSIAYSRQTRTQGRRPAHAFLGIRTFRGKGIAPDTQHQSPSRQVAVTAAAAEAEIPTSETGPNMIIRVLAILPYILPVIESLGFGRELWESYALVSKFVIFFNPILMLYHSNNVIPFMVFFMLFLLVVRNTKLPHFVRFNAMQSMLLDISLMLAALIITYMPIDLIRTAFGRFCCTFTFLTSISAVLYSVVYTLRGRYADIPVLSEACYIQVRPE